jgi:aldehyde:ferredoxin oxidoreductase
MNVRIPDGPYSGVWGHGPEYETLAGFGGNCQCDDLNAITAMNDLCNRLGLDTISTSSVIAFAMEAFERGLITLADTGGLELSWGNSAAMLETVRAIAQRQGIGSLLADGVRAAARRIGPAAEPLAIHVKGMEIPYHDPRAFVSMAANYATAGRGACHLEAITYWVGYGVRFEGWYNPSEWEDHDSRGKAQVAVDFQNYMSVYNPLGLCKFIAKGRVTPQRIADLIQCATGWSWTAADVLHTGERIFNLKRLINLRLGITGADDTLPARLLTEPRPTGGAAGIVPDLQLQLADYYRIRGWAADGVPTQQRLAALALA